MAKAKQQPGKLSGKLSTGDIAATFLGTLRSELDEPEVLPAVMASIFAEYIELRQRYDEGITSEAEFSQELKGLIFIDKAGDEWTLGASSTRWYRRRPGGHWVATPPDLAVV
jgi:hypothetical protein